MTAYDTDAPTGSGWWHWVVYDIPPTARALPGGAGGGAGGAGLPAEAVQGRTDFGAPGFGGACPPPGRTHRYVFTVHAVSVDRLDAPADASPALIGFLTWASSLGQASLTVQHGR